MKKFLLLAVSMLLTSSLFAQYDFYLRGVVNGWNNLDGWGFTSTDGGNTYTLEKTFTMTGAFKFASQDWNTINYGKGAEAAVLNTPFALQSGSQSNFDCGAKTFNVTKIVIDMVAETATIFGTSGTDEFDVNTDYNLLFGQYFETASLTTRDAMTFKGNGTYEVTTVIKTQDKGCKVANEDYSVDFGSNGSDVQVGIAYEGAKGGPNLWFDEETIEFDKTYKLTITIDKNYNSTFLFEITTNADEAQANAAEVVGIYNMIGQPVSAQTPGLKIFVYSNGTTEKKY